MAKDEKRESRNERSVLHHMTVGHLQKPLQNTAVKPSDIEPRQMTVGHLAKPIQSGGQSGGDGGGSKDSGSSKK